MGQRAYNFNAGPAALPLEVLQQAQEEFVEYQGIGMSIMEISHRSKHFERINQETQDLIKELLNVPNGYQVLFVQGGASTQFAMIPMNFLNSNKVGSYVMTGSWADKALEEAKIFGNVSIAASAEASNWTKIPDVSEIRIDNNTAYLHVTSNETIGGIQFKQFPDSGNVPLIADMSSDIMSRPIDVNQFALIYAGAQKNLGPSGVTVVIIRDDLLQSAPERIGTMLNYQTHAQNNSLYNTPPVYSIYMMKLVLNWVRSKGGLAEMAKLNELKAKLIYDVIEQSDGFYQGVADPSSRSLMNITWRMGNSELEQKFIKESEQQGFVGLKGHRSVGGLRASAYNAVPNASCQALADFMNDFQRRNQ